MVEDIYLHAYAHQLDPCSDIPPNWKDIRTKFGYTPLYAILLGALLYDEVKHKILIRRAS